jgi:hypothetical protein
MRAARQEPSFQEAIHVLGKPCKHGHATHGHLNVLYKRNGACMLCERKRQATRLALLAKQKLCRVCGKRKPHRDRKRCAVCLQARCDRRYDRNQARLDQGLCVYCAKQAPETGKESCEACLKLLRDRKKATRAKHQADGACKECGGTPRFIDHPICERCWHVRKKHELNRSRNRHNKVA